MVEFGSRTIRQSGFRSGLIRKRQCVVIDRDLLAGRQIQPTRDPSHLRMSPLPFGKVFHLSRKIPRVEPGEARDEVAVALAP
jgi:hypothetical protein